MTDETREEPVGHKLPNYIIGACVLIAIAYFSYEVLFRKSKGIAASQPTFLIAGPSGSGKTSLYALLRYGERATTVPSIEPNMTAKFRPPGLPESAKSYVLVDSPGHQKLRHYMFSTLDTSTTARTMHGIVFVVDASAMSRPEKLREAAEYLGAILRKTNRRRGGADILVAANKSELFTAVPAKRLKTLMENELDKLAKSKANSVMGVDADTGVDDDEYMQLQIGEFKFEACESEVTFLDGSIETGKIESWLEWMTEKAVNNH
ncbi:signal recognition particle receptor beta subunit-domain-containing protein [Lipomyces arxii]|uniref:signal recognition particle receptor beta subunit-domain-containing protein n=1 Tax=Lipomyces arxii TaxID=56418 RepID=UPI0034CD085F